ncbi:MAG: class I SAM-dependent methyltransferase [Solirubrobacteraceae bacterium]
MTASEWKKSEHVDHYLALVDTVPHRAEGEGVLLEHVPLAARRILDLGTGDGRLLALLRAERPESVAVAVDVSEPMLERARERFADQPVEVRRHDLAEPLPDLGRFDSVVSSLAIHHLEDERKRSLYGVAPSSAPNPTLSVCRHSRRAAAWGRLGGFRRRGVAGGAGPVAVVAG